jgi:thiol-disulfide isomerase/thioredoxin
MSKAVRSSTKNARKDNIRNEIDQRDKAIVLFYATWCTFSQSFLPVFKEYARSNPQECMSVIVDDRPDLCEKYTIEYYPTVLIFKEGKIYKRLDAEPGVGLNKKQLAELTKNP